MAKKYLVVGGDPFRGYTGTLTYTGMGIVGQTSNEKEVDKMVSDNYDECGGLISVFSYDEKTGKFVDVTCEHPA